MTGDPSLAELLAWAEFTPSSVPEMKPVGEVLAALTAGPADDELAGEAAALAAYRNRGGVPRPATRAHRRTRRPLLSFPLSRAAASVAAAVVISFSAFAAAAYTQVLPAPVQQLAHVIIGAPGAGGGGPARGPSPAGSGASVPGATGPGGAGRAGGTPTGKAQPSPTPHASGQSTPQGSGQPSTEPTPSDSGTPTPTKSKGKPSTHPTNGNGNGGSGNGNGNGNSGSTPTPQP